VRRIVWVCSALLGASACGPWKTDVRTRSGLTLFGGTVAYFDLLYSDPTHAAYGLRMEIHESPEGCTDFLGGSTILGGPNNPSAVLSVGAGTTQLTPLEPGRFQIGGTSNPGLAAAADYNKYPRWVPGTSGEVELNSVSSTEAKGTVDVTLLDDTRMQGEFLAAPCPDAPVPAG